MKNKSVAASFICCLVWFTENAQTLSLQELLQKVELHSKEIKVAEYKLGEKLLLVEDAKNDQLPDFTITASLDKASDLPVYDNGLFHPPSKHEIIHTLYASYGNMYISIYEGLKKRNTIKLMEMEGGLERTLFIEKQASVKLQAIFLFFELYLQIEWEKLMKADINEKEYQLKKIKDFYELGMVLHSDVLRTELELSKRKMALIEIENQQTKINQQLNNMIGNREEEKVFPNINLEELPRYESLKNVMNESHVYAYTEKQSYYHIKNAEKEFELIKASNSVKVGLTASFQFSNPQTFLYPYNDSWYNLGLVGVKATYSLSELYKNKNKKKAAKIAVEAAHEQHEKTIDDARTKIYQDYLALDEVVKHVSIYKLNETYALENARILKEAYFNQTALITDLLDADVLVLKSQFELKQAQISVFKNYYKLEYSKGSL